MRQGSSQWYEGGAEPDGPAKGPRSAAARASATVLVVEDLEVLRATLVLYLESLGYRALSAEDGLEALEVLEREPDIALVLADLGMPRMGGRELHDAVSRRRSDLGFLFCTGDRRAIGSVSSGMVGWIEKPFELDALAVKVRVMLGDAAGRPSSVSRARRAVARPRID